MNYWNEEAQRCLDEQGYVIFENLVDEETVAHLRQKVLELQKRETEVNGSRNPRIWNLLNKGSEFGELIQHPDVLSAMRYLLGEEAVLSSWSANIIHSEDPIGFLHVDVPLMEFPEPLPDMALTANSVWLLDDFTEENGATHVLPGSHRSLKKPKPGEEQRPDLVKLVAPKGSVIIFNGSLWHGSGKNQTGLERVGLLGYFCRPYIRPMEDWQRIVEKEAIEGSSSVLQKIMGVGHGVRPGSLIGHSKIG
ncbi:phytanoyl-CoA dioxygenase family protein [Ammoniphilus sp. YIM 78166]|uniref:phytanoyl-CoA dioxygenase family protein n=1 Tax=Ammoniphilus sp. YIM 78166 TaxID=1644106 RepID=UPI00106F7CDD|nr:phytanoyl-CoA dioxygenase family protein [Ammoniphilus sp. YIM 78166]